MRVIQTSLFGLISCVVLGLHLTASSSWASTRSPQLDFSRYSVDFGTVKQGQILKHLFHFTNTGQDPLKILGTHAACGCTAVEHEDRAEYKAGERGSIEITFDTSNFVGTITKSVTVMSNVALRPHRSLSITANVEADFSVDRPIVDFGPRSGLEKHKSQVVITPINSFKLDKPKIEFESANFTAQLSQLPNGYLLEIELKKNPRPQSIHEVLTLLSNSPSKPRFDIHLTAEILGALRHEPKYLEFGSIRKNEISKRLLHLRITHAVELKEGEVELRLNGQKISDAARLLEWTWQKSTSTEHELVLCLRNDAKLSGSVHGHLAVHTSEANQKKVKVDFYGFFM